jgi:hypothetical protein
MENYTIVIANQVDPSLPITVKSKLCKNNTTIQIDAIEVPSESVTIIPDSYSDPESQQVQQIHRERERERTCRRRVKHCCMSIECNCVISIISVIGIILIYITVIVSNNL